jgi:nitrite reductase/ring-hydroxylating ferredoxin subunit
MLVNVASLGAFAAAWAFRNLESWHPGVGTLVLELAGALGVTVGGWLGGTLVYRNQIGVDHRYAHAGKWNEADARTVDGGTAVVGRADELKVNQMKLVHLDGRRIVVARTEEGYVAFDDHCTHRGGSLADGALACGTVQCPWHGSQFDVRSGTVKAGPAEQPISTYTVVESGGELRLSLTHVVPGGQPRGAAAS